MSNAQIGKTATPEFIHYTRKYNRDIPSATLENLTALLEFYEFNVTFNQKQMLVIIGENAVYQKNIYVEPTHDSVFTHKVKLHIKSLCARHELPLSIVNLLPLIDVDDFVSNYKKGEVNHG